jgi:hypothetical protein
MDALVAQYSRPALEENDPFEDEAKELMNPADHLSMKFAMPPVTQVSPCLSHFISHRRLHHRSIPCKQHTAS